MVFFKALVGPWTLLVTAALICSCSGQPLSARSGVSNVTQLSAWSVYSSLQRVPAAQRQALADAIGELTLREYDALLLGHTATEAVMIDKTLFSNPRRAVEDSAGLMLALGQKFPNVRVLWQRLGVDPAATTYPDVQGYLQAFAAAASEQAKPSAATAPEASALELLKLKPKQPLPEACERQLQSLANLFGFSGTEIANAVQEFLDSGQVPVEQTLAQPTAADSAVQRAGSSLRVFSSSKEPSAHYNLRFFNPGAGPEDDYRAFDQNFVNRCFEDDEDNFLPAPEDTCPLSGTTASLPTLTASMTIRSCGFRH